jgi:hypothetical protein
MSSINNNLIRSITSDFPDDLTLTPLPEIPSNSSSNSSGFFSNITWQTWIIIILIFALIGINIFVYLAKGTDFVATVFNDIFAPILKLFGYTTLETTKQTIQTSATGTKAGVDVVSNTTVGAINAGEQAIASEPQGQMAASSQQGTSLQQEQESSNQYSPEGSLEKALENASQSVNQGPSPDDSRSVFQSNGKAGWCFIGQDQGVRTCSEIGVNDMCMSGDIFPTQEICMNPRLRA